MKKLIIDCEKQEVTEHDMQPDEEGAINSLREQSAQLLSFIEERERRRENAVAQLKALRRSANAQVAALIDAVLTVLESDGDL